MTDAEITVRHRPEADRYEIVVGGEVAGHTAYRRDGDVWVFVHTEIDDRFEGQGLGGRLVSGALDDVRRQGIRIVAECPFVAGYIDKHPDYADLLTR